MDIFSIIERSKGALIVNENCLGKRKWNIHHSTPCHRFPLYCTHSTWETTLTYPGSILFTYCNLRWMERSFPFCAQIERCHLSNHCFLLCFFFCCCCIKRLFSPVCSSITDADPVARRERGWFTFCLICGGKQRPKCHGINLHTVLYGLHLHIYPPSIGTQLIKNNTRIIALVPPYIVLAVD